MSRRKPRINSKASMNVFTLKRNIRSMLRRNLTMMLSIGNHAIDDKKREQLKVDSENMARQFTCVLSILVSYMSDEEICDFLDGWKHIIIDCHDKPIIHFD